MFSTVFFISVIISQNIFVNCKPADSNSPVVDKIYNVQEKMAIRFPKGIVHYVINPNKYDTIITKRIKKAMDLIEASSCVVFKEMSVIPSSVFSGSWIHFTNPFDKRDCVHQPVSGDNGEIMIEIGFDCMASIKILQAVLHAIGFKDEVTHPHRDQYIKVIWENIQPGYRPLYNIQEEDEPYKVVEYDPMSVMHFHDRAYSINGALTIVPRIPGLVIAPSTKLSLLDVMKLRLWFGHECNKRKIGALLDKCKVVLSNSPMALAGKKKEVDDRSISADDYNNNFSTDDDDSGSGNVVLNGTDNGGNDKFDDDDASGGGNMVLNGTDNGGNDKHYDDDDASGGGNMVLNGTDNGGNDKHYDDDDASGGGNMVLNGTDNGGNDKHYDDDDASGGGNVVLNGSDDGGNDEDDKDDEENVHSE